MNQPVWSVYDKLRTARLNVKYYGRRLQKLERTNFVMELVLLISAPSSAVAGLWFWQSDAGHWIWKSFGIVAAFLAVLKPLLGLTKRIKDYECVLSGYRALEYDLMEIKSLIEQKQSYDTSLQSEFKKALQWEKTLVGKCPESSEHSPTKKMCEAEVLSELPENSFFVP